MDIPIPPHVSSGLEGHQICDSCLRNLTNNLCPKFIEDEKQTCISGGTIVEPFKSEIHGYLFNTSEFKYVYFESDNCTDTLLGKEWTAHYLNCPNKAE